MQTPTTGVPIAHDFRYPSFDEALATYLEALRRLDEQPDDATRIDEAVREAAYHSAERTLLELPAETLEEFRVKFDILWHDPQSTPSNQTVLTMFADLRRLTDGTPSKVFRPDLWLRYFELRGGMYCVRGNDVFLLQPTGADLHDWMFELEASGGREAVYQLIRERTEVTEAIDGQD